MRVLVIEDSVFYQNIYQKFCEKYDLECVICEHGTYALEALSTDIFDIVFLDLKLPDCNGKDIYFEICELQDTKVVPVTGYEKEIHEGVDFFSMFKDYIFKPFDERELLQALNISVDEEARKETFKAKRSNNISSKADLMDFCHTVGFKLSNKLFDEFLKSLNIKVPSLPSLYRQGHYFEVENTVHQLKANCRYFGFYGFADICERIERQISTDPHLYVQDQLDHLINLSGDLRQSINWARNELRQQNL